LKAQNVAFSMPLATTTDVETMDETQKQKKDEYLSEMKEFKSVNLITVQSYPLYLYLMTAYGNTGSVSSTPFDQDDPSSLLLFQGSENVASLYDFLVEYEYVDEPPTLYSTVAFTNASLKQVQIKSNGTVIKQGVYNSLFILLIFSREQTSNCIQSGTYWNNVASQYYTVV
jgi:hypothetical protein